jgi:hypothetical protein
VNPTTTRPVLRRRPRSLALLGLGLVLVACNNLPERRGASVVQGVAPSGALEEANPADIVVAPILDETGNRAFPAAMLREAFQAGLVKRRYSPLGLAYVDDHVVEGAYTPGTLEEDAVLTVIVESWDTTYLESRGGIAVRAEARLTDAATQGLLWSGRIDRSFDFGSLRARNPTRERFQREACDKIAGEILAALPARTPQP